VARAVKNESLAERATPDELPEGWSTASLGDIAKAIQYGYTASAMQGRGPRFLRITDIQNGSVDWSTVPTCDITKADAEKYGLRSGDIVFARTGATTGKSFLIGECPIAVFASYLIRVRIDDSLCPEFLAAFFNTPQYWEFITENVAGNAQPNCNASKLAALPVPIAPAAEQARIVAKIDQLFTHVNASREHLAKVPKILKAFRQSVLAAACSGRLTEDWRDEHSEIETASSVLARIRRSHEQSRFNFGGQAADPTEGVHNLDGRDFPDSWCLADLKWLCTPGRPITYGILKPGPHYAGGVPYVRVADFPGNRLELAGVRRTSPEIAHTYRRSALKAGDVLLSIRGTVGRTCRVPEELGGANITQDTARISVHSEVNADYLEIYLQSPSVQQRFQAAMKGVAVRGVNIGDVRALQVALPPVQEQQEIVRRVRILFKLADEIEKRVEAATKRAGRITQAVLAKAFRGELVPTEAELARREGRTYEPASVLLERIKAERNIAVASRNGRIRRS